MPLPHFSNQFSLNDDMIFKNLYDVRFITDDVETFKCSVQKFEISNDRIECYIQDSSNTGISNLKKLKYMIISYTSRSDEIIRVDILEIENINYKSTFSWDTTELSHLNVFFDIKKSSSMCVEDDNIDSLIIIIIRDEKLNKLFE